MNHNAPRARDEVVMDDEINQNGNYDLMLHLERLETLREDMEELGIRSLEELERQIAEIHRQLDEKE